MEPTSELNIHHTQECGVGLQSRLRHTLLGWCRAARGLERSRLIAHLFGLIATLLLSTLGSYTVWQGSIDTNYIFPIQLVLLAAGMLFARAILRTIQSEFHQPLSNLRIWASQIRKGKLSSRMNPPASGEFIGLVRDINSVGESLEKLSAHMDAEVKKQTQRTAYKRHHLQVLYDVAASLNSSSGDLAELLSRFLHTMRDIINAEAGSVRLLDPASGNMELVASTGLNEETLDQERFVAPSRCLCGQALLNGVVLYQDDLSACTRWTGGNMVGNNDSSLVMIAVPLQHRGKFLGVYNLFVQRDNLESRDEIKDLFTSIGRHLGMAIEKARLDNESRRLTIIQERTALAHELHDSLAQTLAGMRFQVSMLDDTLMNDGIEAAREEISQLKDDLNDAYTELRELLAHFRAPMNSRGLLPALEDWISSFRKQTGIRTLLQKEWDSTRLTPEMEMQVLRIIQEALVNVRKHSRANYARVLMHCTAEGKYRVLIEDDGIGLENPAFSGHPGEHIGLSIMEERARYLNGELHIESEPGEGTQVMLTFDHPSDSPTALKTPYASEPY